MKILATSLIALSVTAAPAFAQGVLITQKTTSNGTTQTSQVQLEPTRMRVEMGGQGARKAAMIFDSTKQVMTQIDYDRQQYREMTKAEADQIGGQMQDAMSQMQAQMANMPPAQRAQIEAMMRGRMGAAMAQAPKIEYRPAGSDKVGRWTCDKYEGFESNNKVSEICTVQPAALGLAPADFAVALQMQQFFMKMMPQSLDTFFAPGERATQGFSGIPIRSVCYSNGQIQSTTELGDITRQAFPASSYEVPAGFQKMEMPGGMGRGRGRM